VVAFSVCHGGVSTWTQCAHAHVRAHANLGVDCWHLTIAMTLSDLELYRLAGM
jgi:hypothetical protein